ncbi:hypothetical protein [uncultured Roseobacter sp.]|uniref:hypothetical protein n=1 Tax=uncultured Roseobacter sp. TaxID=114847 RepID=UPI0026150D45|nr:hypothetical protein [uncultured Roseobacter sp.]
MSKKPNPPNQEMPPKVPETESEFAEPQNYQEAGGGNAHKDTKNKGPFEELFTKAGWLFRKPGGALLLLVIGLFIAFGTGVGSWIATKTGEGLDWACAKVGFCDDDAPPKPPWKIVFSTAVHHCLTGRLTFELREWKPPVIWQEGADRIAICGDAVVKGSKKSIPKLIETRFPECVHVAETDEAVTVTAQLDSGALCRAPYRYDGAKIVSSPPDRGVILCVPGQGFDVADNEHAIPACHDRILESFGFE